MKITKVEYSKTFNLGNYQSERISLEADISDEPQDNEVQASQAIRNGLDFLHAQVHEKHDNLKS